MKSVLSEELLLKNTSATRCSVCPLRSSGSMVFSKVGASVVPTTAATSASCSSIPSSKAGR